MNARKQGQITQASYNASVAGLKKCNSNSFYAPECTLFETSPDDGVDLKSCGPAPTSKLFTTFSTPGCRVFFDLLLQQIPTGTLTGTGDDYKFTCPVKPDDATAQV